MSDDCSAQCGTCLRLSASTLPVRLACMTPQLASPRVTSRVASTNSVRSMIQRSPTTSALHTAQLGEGVISAQLVPVAFCNPSE